MNSRGLFSGRDPVAPDIVAGERRGTGCPKGRTAGFICLFGLSRGALGLQSALLSMVESGPDEYWEDFIELRRGSMPEPAVPCPTRQSAWDRPVVEKDKAEIRLR